MVLENVPRTRSVLNHWREARALFAKERTWVARNFYDLTFSFRSVLQNVFDVMFTVIRVCQK